VAQWSVSHGKIDAQVLALLQECTSALRTVLATNATSRLPQDLAALGLSARFDAIANSSEFGVMKPQAEFYRRTLQSVDAPPQRALYVDDSVANIEAAAALGITAHRFIGCAPLREFLRRAGAIES
jgi:putative hydrolase of the HAD superfamily